MNRADLARWLRRWLRAAREEMPRQAGRPDEPGTDSADPSSVEAGEPFDNGDDSPPEPSRPDPEEQLIELRESARGCTLCGLKEGRTQVVFDQGTTRARVMVIGEAPGAREDEQGVPFVGPSGELLRKGFKKVGLEEDDLYITNTVKCRPPENRDPEADELEACRPYLNRQLDLVDPVVVLSLGSFALQYCLGDDHRITRSRGEVYDWEGRDLVPTFHPGYVLRNRSAAQDFVNDLHRAASLLDDE